MKALSLDSINAQAAYLVVAGESQSGTFLFSTVSGNDYAISFNEDMEIAGCLSYQFVIRRLNNHISGHDPKIQITIMAIIDEFFRQNQDILLYTCDTEDRKEAARNRLFIRWFKEAESSSNFVLKTADTVVEGQGFYFAIIVPKSHPNLAAICSEFDTVAENLSQKPE